MDPIVLVPESDAVLVNDYEAAIGDGRAVHPTGNIHLESKVRSERTGTSPDVEVKRLVK
jgi:hypothetical protein